MDAQARNSYSLRPQFRVTRETPATYYPSYRVLFPGVAVYKTSDIQFFRDTEAKHVSRKNFWRSWALVIGGVTILAFVVGAAENQNTTPANTAATSDAPVTSDSISQAAGISTTDANGEFAVINRYHLDPSATGIIAQNAAYLYGLESSDQYGAVLQVDGVGSLDTIADTFANIIQAWNVSDSDVAHSLNVIFNGLTSSSISWSDYTGALIANGPRMNKYTSLVDAASVLAALQESEGTQSALTVFNTIGEQIAEPNSQLNIAMGGPGYIRTLVQQQGLDTALEKITNFVAANTIAQ